MKIKIDYVTFPDGTVDYYRIVDIDNWREISFKDLIGKKIENIEVGDNGLVEMYTFDDHAIITLS